MTVKEFVEKYNKLDTQETKEKYLSTLIKNIYVPYERKIALCNKIIEISSYVQIKDKDNSKIKKLHFDSTGKYMLLRLNIINEYSEIDIDYKNSLEEFNLLNKNRVINYVMDHILTEELTEFMDILEMKESDLIKNEYETHAFISAQVERFGTLFGITMSPALEKLISSIEDMDEKRLDVILNKIKSTGIFK